MEQDKLEPLYKEIDDLRRKDRPRKTPNLKSLRAKFDVAMRLAPVVAASRPRNTAGWYEEWEETQSDLGVWLVFLPLDLAEAGLVDEAVKLARAWSLVAMEDWFMGHLCVVLAEAGRRGEALAQIEETLRLFPCGYWPKSHAGDALLALGEPERALDTYRQVQLLAKNALDRDEAWDREADALDELGRTGEAEAVRRKMTASWLRSRSAECDDGCGGGAAPSRKGGRLIKDDPMPTKKPAADPVVYQLRVVLKDSQPAIWRRLLVRSDLTLRALHHVLQVTMGWTNSHLHQFAYKKKRYGYPDRDGEDNFGLKTFDDSKVRLDQLITGKGQCLIYEYDLGDSWEHFLTVEEVLPLDEDKPPVLCLAGARACPPEDVGGVGGYEDFLNAISNPNHSEHKNMLRWAGGAFDPEAFDLNRVNRLLQGVLRKPRGKAAA